VSSLAKVPCKSNLREPKEVELVGVSAEVKMLVKSKSTVNVSCGAPTPRNVNAVAVSAKGSGEIFPTGKLRLLSDTRLPAVRNPGGWLARQPLPAVEQKLFGLPR
jgi:hypothetical protein